MAYDVADEENQRRRAGRPAERHRAQFGLYGGVLLIACFRAVEVKGNWGDKTKAMGASAKSAGQW
jgi:hypothetical protein